MVEKPEEYKGHYEIVNGKRVLVVECKSEEISYKVKKKNGGRYVEMVR